MNIVLLGKPGAGKGSVSEFLQKEYGLFHLSTGELCRKHIKEKTSLGVEIEKFISSGQLVPFNLIMQILKNELDKNVKTNYIFDGFPRNISQAKELDNLIKVDMVLLVDVPNHIILDRISKRRICTSCHKVYSVDNVKNNTCLSCGGMLEFRKDDNLETAKHRIELYEQETQPLVDYYKNKIFVVDNSGKPQETLKKLKAITDIVFQK